MNNMPVPTGKSDSVLEREEAAVKIQAAWRGHMERKNGKAQMIRSRLSCARTNAHIKALSEEAAIITKALVAEHELLRLQGSAVKALWTKVQQLQELIQVAINRESVTLPQNEIGDAMVSGNQSPIPAGGPQGEPFEESVGKNFTDMEGVLLISPINEPIEPGSMAESSIDEQDEICLGEVLVNGIESECLQPRK